ncbi:MAG: hypothetical protein CL566_06005 [Alphaproteobacteria bacterium]|nr:hypothetical protein [Alphaproteobacteria bacterium]
MRRFLLPFAMLVAVAAATPATAMEKVLTGAEIRAWINGNTIDGTWAGSHYRLFFRTDGISAYGADGARLELRRWWATETEYCSWWQGSGEACYQVLRDSDELIWRTKGVFKRSYSARVESGDWLSGQ